MPLSHIPITQIKIEDLQRLIDDGVIESRRIDYKQALPGSQDSDKKEFLADISALANASGGDLIYGISEQRDSKGKPTGVPERIDGVKVDNFDALRLQIDQIIAAGIAPRIMGIEIEKIEQAPHEPVIVIRIPQSLLAPHMIVFKDLSRFYLRGVASNHRMDVTEIREAFFRTANLLERAANFRARRIEQVLAGLGPVDLPAGAKVFVHIVPLGSSSFAIDFTRRAYSKPVPQLILLNSSMVASRLNFDGEIQIDGSQKQGVRSYLQKFHNGSLEFCDTQLARTELINGHAMNIIAGRVVEVALIRAVKVALQFYETVGITPPFAVFVAFVGVKGYQMIYSRQGYGVLIEPGDFPPVDRNDPYLAGQIIERREVDVPGVMRPILDTIFNAAGAPQAPGYDEKGNWVE